MRFLITGTAGFIGFHLARRLLQDGHIVVGIDAMTPYYDVRLKYARHALLLDHLGFSAHTCRLEDFDGLCRIAEDAAPDVIVHLAAQAGVRYSINHPGAYTQSNLVGSFNILELARNFPVRHLLLASTSSAYGANDSMPFRESDKADRPLTFYAATKKAMEDMSHAYAHLFAIPTTCFRFFTVYGPWGRPDMALFKFVDAIESGRPIEVYGQGRMRRDFTYVGDLVEAVVRLMDRVPAIGDPIRREGVSDTLSPVAPWRLVNIAGGEPVDLLQFISWIEHCLSKPALLNLLPMQPGDVRETYADHRLLEALTGYRPRTTVEAGVTAFVQWYRQEQPRIYETGDGQRSISAA